MFSFLNFLNQGLNYFNFFNLGSRGNQILNRVYLVLSTIGDSYLFYVAIRFVKNQYLLHGTLIFLVALGLVYLILINVDYYFLGRTAAFDISQLISRKLGIRQPSRTHSSVVSPINEIQGWWPNRQASRFDVPADLTANFRERQNLDRVAQQVIARRDVYSDYANLSRGHIADVLRRNGNRPVYAIGRGISLHWFRVVVSNRNLELYVGADHYAQVPVGRIRRVGLFNVSPSLPNRWLERLTVSSVVLVGGEYQILGRSGIHRYRENYHLVIKVSRTN